MQIVVVKDELDSCGCFLSATFEQDYGRKLEVEKERPLKTTIVTFLFGTASSSALLFFIRIHCNSELFPTQTKC